VVLAASALLLAPAAIAQSGVRRVGVLGMISVSSGKEILDAFRDAMRGLGHVEGKNLVIEYRQLASETDQRPAREMVARKVDLIVAWATPPSMTARDATSTIPIVIVGVADPVTTGLVKSLARPGGNLTGITNFSVELVTKQLQILQDLVPGLQRLGIVANLGNPAVRLQLQQTERSMRELGLRWQVVEGRTPAEFDKAFERLKASGIGAAVMLPDPSLVEHRAMIARAAIKARVATMFQRRENAEAGGLISYGPDITDQFRQVAGYVDRIFQGARPGDLPVQQPTKLSLVVDARTAKAIGITIPQSVLLRADKVIE